jgi:hypothetical protein
MKSAVMKFVAALGVVGALALTATAASSNHRIVTADVAELETNGGGPAGQTIEADPTDDGSIIVECVSLAAVLNAGPLQGGSSSSLTSMPQNPLGPLKCWPSDGRQIR